MNSCSDHRKGDFKKTVDAVEGRRRRNDTTLKIRKAKRDEQLKKKRAGAGADASSAPMDATFMSSSNPQTDAVDFSKSGKDTKPTIADAPRLRALLMSPVATGATLAEATKGFRRILSVPKNVPVREVVDMGIVPYLVRNLSTNSSTSNASLIFESAWALTNIASTEFTQDVINAGCIKPLVQLLTHADARIREQAAWCLGNIAGEGPGPRDLILQESALDDLIFNMVNPQNLSLLENVIWTISNLCRGTPSPPKEVTLPAIYPMAALLGQPISDSAKIDILWALSYLSDGDEQKIELVLGSGVATTLNHLLQDNSVKNNFKTPIVRILGNFVSGSDSQTQVVINAGILNHLAGLLASPSKMIRKEASWLASNIACGNHEQITLLVQKSKILRQIIGIAKNDSWEVRKEALWALAHICTSGTHRHTVSMVDAGGLEPLIAVLAVQNIDPALLVAILDALRKVLDVGEAFGNLGYEQLIDENNGIEYLEELQTHPSELVYEKVISLIEDYFGIMDEADENLAPETNEAGTFGFGFAGGLASPKQLFPNINATENVSKDASPFGKVSTNTMMYPV